MLLQQLLLAGYTRLSRETSAAASVFTLVPVPVAAGALLSYEL